MNELPEYPCPTCGRRGCAGYCEADDIGPPPEPVDTRCTICGENWVDAANGYDTCAECLARQ